MENPLAEQSGQTPRTLIVTGGSRGIGAATARLAASRGYRVCVNYVSDEAAASRAVADIVRGGGTAVASQANIGIESEVVSLFRSAEEKLGRPTALVNNAAILEAQMRLDSMDSARISRLCSQQMFWERCCARGRRYAGCPRASAGPAAVSSTCPPAPHTPGHRRVR